MPTEHFRNKEAYRKYRAYTHIHGIPTHAKDVVVGGKKHKVKHSKLKDRKLGRRKGGNAKRRTQKKTARKEA